MPVNVKLLKKVRKLIAEEPRRLRMGHWGKRRTKREAAMSLADLPPCRTTACLAGHIILAAQPKKTWAQLFNRDGYLRLGERFNRRGTATMAAIKAAKLIGLDADECPFGEMGWKAPEVLAWIDRQIDAASK